MLKLNGFAEVYNHLKRQGGRISILLGNGFSIGACPEFGDANLWVPFVQNLTSRGFSPLRHPSNQSGLEQALIVELPQRGREGRALDTDTVRSNGLVEAVSTVHPEGRQQVTETMLCDAARFVSKFDDIFTTNYDLLTYWVCMHLLDGLSGKCGAHLGQTRIQDGISADKKQSAGLGAACLPRCG